MQLKVILSPSYPHSHTTSPQDEEKCACSLTRTHLLVQTLSQRCADNMWTLKSAVFHMVAVGHFMLQVSQDKNMYNIISRHDKASEATSPLVTDKIRLYVISEALKRTLCKNADRVHTITTSSHFFPGFRTESVKLPFLMYFLWVFSLPDQRIEQ